MQLSLKYKLHSHGKIFILGGVEIMISCSCIELLKFQLITVLSRARLHLPSGFPQALRLLTRPSILLGAAPVSHPLITKPRNHRIKLRLEKSTEVTLEPPTQHHDHFHHRAMSSKATATRALTSSRDRLHLCPGKSVPMPEHSFNEDFFGNIPPKPSQHRFL